MLALRVCDRRRPPERVEGIDPLTTLGDLRGVVCWVLRRGVAKPDDVRALVIDGVSHAADDATGRQRTLAACGVTMGSLVRVEFSPAVDTAAAVAASRPAEKRSTQHPRRRSTGACLPVSPLYLTHFRAISMEPATGNLRMEDAGGGICFSPQRRKPGLVWYLDFQGALFPAERSQTRFSLPCGVLEAEAERRGVLLRVNSRLFGLTVWEAEVSATEAFVTLLFATERSVTSWAHTHSRALGQLPADVLNKIVSFLSPQGALEV